MNSTDNTLNARVTRKLLELGFTEVSSDVFEKFRKIDGLPLLIRWSRSGSGWKRDIDFVAGVKPLDPETL